MPYSIEDKTDQTPRQERECSVEERGCKIHRREVMAPFNFPSGGQTAAEKEA